MIKRGFFIFAFSFLFSCKSEVKNDPVVDTLEEVEETDTMAQMGAPDDTVNDTNQQMALLNEPKSDDYPISSSIEKTNTSNKPKQTDAKQEKVMLKMGSLKQEKEEDVNIPANSLPADLKIGTNATSEILGGKEEKPIEKPKTVEAVSEAQKEVTSTNEAIHKHQIFAGLLSSYVSNVGIVDYKSLKSKETELDQYLKLLSENVPTNSWSRDQKLAYWINVYNAFTIKVILKNYPLKSIKDLSGGKIWDSKWIDLAGIKYSLNDIENNIVRPQFKDARIHFALNCGAKSCPPLSNKAFLAGNVQELLEQNAIAFVRNKSMNEISANKVKISSIFDWYSKDFGDLTSFLSKYSGVSLSKQVKIEFKEYDWSLNGK